MDKFPLLWNGRAVGELTTERQELYTWFTARCRLPERGLWCAWAVGDQGELRLGVVEPEGSQATIRRRFSDRMTVPLGKLQRGELRPVKPVEQGTWEAAERPEMLFQTPWLRAQLREVKGVLTRKEAGIRYLAVPYDPKRPFLLTRIFCCARRRRVQGQAYAIFTFDGEELPVFS